MGSPAAATYGPAIIGVCSGLVLYGIIICQAFTYYRNYPKDAMRIKATVGFAVFADTLYSIFGVVLLHDVLINHYNDPQYLLQSHWLYNAYPAFVGIISSVVQIFFALRVKALTKNNWFFGFICIMCIGQLAAGLAISIKSGQHFLWIMTKDLKELVPIWLIFSMVAEISITSILTWYLRKPSMQMGSSHDVLKRITRLTFSNGLASTLWVFGDVICYLVGEGQMHLIFCYPLAKIYIITMMCTLLIRPTYAERQARSERPVTMSNNQSCLRHSVRRQPSYYKGIHGQNTVPGSPSSPAVVVMPPIPDFDLGSTQTLTETGKECLYTGKEPSPV